MMYKRYGSMLGLVVLLAAVAGCGGGPGGGTQSGGAAQGGGGSAVYRKLNGLPAGEQRAEAVRMAKDEGALSLYTSYNSDVLGNVKKAFEDRFGIEVQTYRAHSETLTQRVQQESRARRPGADAVESDFLAMAVLSDSHVFARYGGRSLRRVRDGGRFRDWAAEHFNIFVPVRNKRIIKPGQAPGTWADLADPRFDGKLVLEPGDYDWYAAVTLHWRGQGRSEQEIARLWHDIVDGAAVGKGHTTMTELLAAGQSGVLASDYSYIAQKYVEDGAPVAYRNGGRSSVPAFARAQGVAILRGAQHPAAAWLFEDWLLSPQSQRVLVRSGLAASTDVPGNDAVKGLDIAGYPAKAVHENSKKWSDRYDALLRGVPQQQGS